ncbi:MAG TPA: cytochrome c [Terriglobales bacterium]|jgi:mono/diheme cytochrome c family protein|nr:cytochrome c [Terriglobales bacterium]
MRRLISLTLLSLLFTTSAGSAQDSAPTGSAERGATSFKKYMCYTCHGTLGQGADRGTGPKLAPNPLPFPGFALQVRTPRLDMPAYRKDFVSDQELADIYAYLLTVKASPSVKEIPLLNFQ